jgi:hypothetical protein
VPVVRNSLQPLANLPAATPVAAAAKAKSDVDFVNDVGAPGQPGFEPVEPGPPPAGPAPVLSDGSSRPLSRSKKYNLPSHCVNLACVID